MRRTFSADDKPLNAGDPRDVSHMECDCVPNLGPSHCHKCGDAAGHPVPWADSFHGEIPNTIGSYARLGEGTLTDEEWRAFQSIPDQGYSHRAWVNARIQERLATSRAAAPDDYQNRINKIIDHCNDHDATQWSDRDYYLTAMGRELDWNPND